MPPALRQAVTATLGQASQLLGPMRELMSALTQAMATDQALLAALRQHLAHGEVPPPLRSLAGGLAALPLDTVDPALADAIRRAEAQLLLLGPETARAPRVDGVTDGPRAVLRLHCEQVLRLSTLRSQLAAPLAAPIERLAGGADWAAMVRAQRQARQRVGIAHEAVLQTRALLQAGALRDSAAVAAQAARERTEIVSLQRALAQDLQGPGPRARPGDTLAPQVQSLLARRLQDLDRIAARDSGPSPSDDFVRASLLHSMAGAAEAPEGLGAEWIALQDALGRQVRQWAATAQRLAPAWRERSRRLAGLTAGRTQGIAPDVAPLVDAETALLDAIDPARVDPATVAPARLTDLATTLEALAAVELQLAQAERLLAEDLAAAGDATALGPLRALQRGHDAVQAELGAFDEAGARAGPLWDRFDRWLDRLMAARARHWSDLDRTLAAATPSQPATDRPDALPRLLQAVLAERAAAASDDTAWRSELRRAWATGPVARLNTGRHAHRPWIDAVPLAAFIEQALRELSARATVTRALARIADGSPADAAQAEALLALVDPLTLAWDLAPGATGLQLRIDLGGGTALVDDLTRAKPRLQLAPRARPERLVLAAADDYGSPEVRRFWAETDPSGRRPLSYGGSIVYSMRRSWLSYVLIGGVSAAGWVLVGPELAAGVAVGMAVQAVKDAAFGTIHARVSESGFSPQETARRHAIVDNGEWVTNITTAAYGAYRAGPALYSAVAQRQLAHQAVLLETTMAGASSRIAAANQASRFLQQAEAGGEAAARGRALLLAGSDASDEAVAAMVRAQQVRSAMARLDSDLPGLQRGITATTQEATKALGNASSALDELGAALSRGARAQGVTGTASQLTRGAVAGEGAAGSSPDLAGMGTLKGHGPEAGGAMGDAYDALDTALSKFTDRAGQRARTVQPPGSVGSTAATTSTTTTAGTGVPAIGARTLQETLAQQHQEIEARAALRRQAARPPSVAASAAPATVDPPIIVEPPIVAGGGTTTVPDTQTPTAPAKVASAPTIPVTPVSPAKPTPTVPTTPVVPDVLSRPADDYLWWTWSSCGPAGGWWCSLRLTHDRESHLRQRAELNKQMLTLFKSYPTREAAVAGICADAGELWVGGQFSCGLIAKIYGGDFCVGEFVLFHGDNQSRTCRR